MEDFVAYPSRSRIALLGLGAIGFVVCGLWFVGAFGPPPIIKWTGRPFYNSAVIFVSGWCSIVFFGLCAIVSLKMLFDTSEQVRIGPAGFRYARWSDQTIPWSEITDVTTWSFRRQRSIVLHLSNPERYPGRGALGMMAGANRRLTGGDISVNFNATDRSYEEAISAVEGFRQ